MKKQLLLLACTLPFCSTLVAAPQLKEVTPETFIRAESDRYFYNFAQQAGGVNKFFYYRQPPALASQGVVRMNKDTLYSSAIVDVRKGATLTVPDFPANRYVSVLVLDNDHYAQDVIYKPGTWSLPRNTDYVFLAIRVQLLDSGNPADVKEANRIQDGFVLHANSAVPFAKPDWDPASLDKLRAEYEKQFSTFERYPDEWQGPRGQVNDESRRLAAAGAWGLFANKDATYINYNAHLPADQCYTATYQVPENKAFWSVTVYGADGYMKSDNAVLNGNNVKLNSDGSFTTYFGSRDACGEVDNRLDISDGWNFLMRVYRPGPSVLKGEYTLPDVKPVTK
ncbi:DUF1254 domain-containing protein [Pantoea sp. LMR881]|uniref:DUF1254 domain-containing protein n=1 Tax=Pantoea sp. LMR881 TaxID=3014336 RepID=UPI0022AF7EAF|nr:DUF1254 domain-containing protein [Pantoea sp. LMR881]MCZ4058392.1 DUF1254 domain-containing protein [Pantoea sp. LMR881]